MAMLHLRDHIQLATINTLWYHLSFTRAEAQPMNGAYVLTDKMDLDSNNKQFQAIIRRRPLHLTIAPSLVDADFQLSSLPSLRSLTVASLSFVKLNHFTNLTSLSLQRWDSGLSIGTPPAITSLTNLLYFHHGHLESSQWHYLPPGITRLSIESPETYSSARFGNATFTLITCISL
jgi:hypothetical protein